MSSRFARVALAAVGTWCAVTPAVVAAPAAFAADAGCVGTFTWTFSSPLTRMPGSGTVTQTFDGVCWFGAVVAQVEPFAIGNFSYAVEVAATASGVFSGTCDAAVVSINDYNFVLAQSRLAVAASPDVSANYGSVIAFTPDQPCAVSSATGTGTATAAAALAGT